MEFKPLKVPAVFRLLRPEFREQLKQSSCKVNIPLEPGPKVEHIIPIRREEEDVEDVDQTQHKTETKERIIPIRIVNGNGCPKETQIVNNENNNNVTKVIPIRKDNSESPPKRSTGYVNAPRVTGFNGLSTASSSEKIVPIHTTKDSDTAATKVTATAKPVIVRKLSNGASKVANGEKPTPNPKPEHLKSPPTSPTPRLASRSPPPANTSPPPVSAPSPPPLHQRQDPAPVVAPQEEAIKDREEEQEKLEEQEQPEQEQDYIAD